MQFSNYSTRVLILVFLFLATSSISIAQSKKPVPKKTTPSTHNVATHKTNPGTHTAHSNQTQKTTPVHKSSVSSNAHKTNNPAVKKGTAKSSYHPTSKGKTAYKGKKKTSYKKKKKRYPSKAYVPYNYHEKDMAQRDSFLSRKNINLALVRNPDLLTQIYQWYGVPYRYGGMAKTGTDCAGFVKSVFKAIYDVDLARSATAQYPQCRQVVGEPHEGDLVFFNIRGRYLSHVGIYLQNGYFAHAATHSGVIISNLNEPYYKAYFYRFGAPPTVPGTFIVPVNDSIPMHIEEPDSDSLDATH